MLPIWLLAVVLVVSAFQAQKDIGLDLADEGYLWYGSWRVTQGEVPRVDYRAYDAPRNYWVAFWTIPFGDGPIGLRAGVAAFQILGLGFGLLVAGRLLRRRWLLFPVGVLLLIWMFPRHKYFEHAIAMMAVYVALLVLEKPDLRRLFFAGMFAGLAGSFRRNHAVYACLAFAATILVSNGGLRRQDWLRLPKRLIVFAGGVVVGFFPVWVLMAVHPDFGPAYLDSILVILRRDGTNQPLPIPWPWLVDYSDLSPLLAFHRFGLGVAYVVAFAFYPLAILCLWRTRETPSAARNVLLATTLVGVPYLHHATVRSDVSHLCQVAHPLLLGAIALLMLPVRKTRAWIVAATIGAFSLLTTAVPLFVQPWVTWVRHRGAFVQVEILGDTIWVTKGQAKTIRAARSLVANESGDDVFFAPISTALYPILQRRAPVWDPYPIWPPGPEGSDRMIEDLERLGVRWAVIGHSAVSGDHFWDTHPKVWSHLQSSFEKSSRTDFDPRRYTVFERRAPPVLTGDSP